MSYIRTKDGIHSVEAVPLSNGRIRYSLSNEDSLISKEDFEKITIREADTIEELCDEGVIEVKFSSTGYIAHFNKNIDELRKFLKYLEECQPITKDEILNVYGAIWTEWGLKYVAKMNDKGELVLI